MTLENLTVSLKHEFLCYYHADLIPANWRDEVILDRLASDSVSRLREASGQKGELVSLLKILSNDRNHPINEILSEETDIEWCLEDDDWDGYKRLLNKMVDILEK
ncbi:MAG: hypothetical protein P8X74_23400 [Reinekea sp.]